MADRSDEKTNPAAGPTGRATMSPALPHAQRYHRYLYGRLKSYLVSPVWEIGSGYGQYTRMLLADGFRVTASDVDQELLGGLNALDGAGSGALSVRFVDLNDRGTIASCCIPSPASILCSNVLEHIEQDERALGWMRESCSKGTRAVFLVPAHQALFGFMDMEAGHFRRYSISSLSGVFQRAGWRVERAFYMNPIGALGWLVRNKLLPPASRTLDAPEVNRDIEIFDRYAVPLTSALDPFCAKLFGQSVVAVAIRP